MSCGEIMRETYDGQTTDIPLLIYGEIFSHRAGTGQALEEIDPYLNEEEDIRMDDSSEERWRDSAEEGDNKKNIHALRW